MSSGIPEEGLSKQNSNLKAVRWEHVVSLLSLHVERSKPGTLVGGVVRKNGKAEVM